MITRIEIDGFKTFQDFKLDLSPFQVIVGPNGAGKSNLFDALHLLSRLADKDLRSAFHELRGDAIELFTAFPNGQKADKMKLAVELLVDRSIEDNWGHEVELKYTRMRYELEIARIQEQGPGRLRVLYESLKPILRKDDSWCKRHGLSTENNWLPKVAEDDEVSFLSLKGDTMNLYEEPFGTYLTSFVPTDRAVLSRVDPYYLHAFAARKEIRLWKFLQLNPEILRSPSSVLDTPFLSEQGHNLAATLVRMREENPFLLTDVSADLASLVPEMLNVEIDTDQARNQYIVRVTTEDRTSFSSKVLSDGTLRMLAFATLRNDPEHRGVLCLEEPENGIHPSRFENLARVLRDLATDFQKADQVNLPLRQLLVNTHSPTFVSQTEIRDAILFAYVVALTRPPEHPVNITRIVPVITSNNQSVVDLSMSKAIRAYTLNEIKNYLNSDSLDDTVHSIIAG